MKGVPRNEQPSKNLSPEIFKAIAGMGADYQPLVVTEFFPHDKINSVPVDKTPYRRYLPGNACPIVHWHTNTPEANSKAKEYAAHLASLIGTTDIGYSNYSKSHRSAWPRSDSQEYGQFPTPTSLSPGSLIRLPTARSSSSATTTLRCSKSRRNMTRTWCSTSGL